MEQKIKLYHGTDARIVRMSAEERKDMKDFCKMVATTLRRYFPAHLACLELFKQPLAYDTDSTTYLNLLNALTLCDGMNSNSPNYNYDYFFVANWGSIAENYARRSFAFGEIGLMAYRILDVCLKMGMKKWGPYPLRDFCKRIIDFAEGEPQPVVFAFDDLDLNCVERANGKKITDMRKDFDINCGTSYRYTKEVHLDLSKAIYL